jgi:hypothetical protein
MDIDDETMRGLSVRRDGLGGLLTARNAGLNPCIDL